MATPSGSRRGQVESPPGLGTGVSKYLADLPSRGLFSSSVISSDLGGIRGYICDHDTSPPEEQVIKTNTTNILIRSLQLNKQKSEGKDGKAKAVPENNRGKRAAEVSLDGESSVKKANIAGSSSSSRRDDSRAFPTFKELQAFTVEKLRTLLKARGLPIKGKKEELLSRLKEE